LSAANSTEFASVFAPPARRREIRFDHFTEQGNYAVVRSPILINNIIDDIIFRIWSRRPAG
jgi:hypothetical protein